MAGTTIRWHRVGRDHSPADLDVSSSVDLFSLVAKIENFVGDRLNGPYAVRIEVYLDGGVDLNRDYGRGRIQAELPKASDD